MPDQKTIKAGDRVGDGVAVPVQDSTAGIVAATCEPVRLARPQLSGNVTISVATGSFTLTPKRSITAYQAILISKLLAILSADRSGFEPDRLFAEIYAETQDHWTKEP